MVRQSSVTVSVGLLALGYSGNHRAGGAGRGSKPVFTVPQQLLHVHFLFPQTAQSRLKFGRIFSCQHHVIFSLSVAEICVQLALNVAAVCSIVLNEVHL